MTHLVEETFEQNNVRFHFVETTKFKTIHLMVKCKAILDKGTITKRALLPYVLEKGSMNYPSEQKLMKKLASLYGASLSIDTLKKGNHHIINFRLQIANEKFIPQEDQLLDQALVLLEEVIFHPLQKNNQLDEAIVKREKRSLLNDITAIYDDKVAFANKRLIEEMCADELYSIPVNGYKEDLSAIDGANLYAYYKQMLSEDDIDVYVLGDFNKEAMAEKVMRLFQDHSIAKAARNEQEKIQAPDEVKIVNEVQPIEQTKLHIGYRTQCTFQDESYFALLLMNGLFGSFPNSKLFQEVREKHSLAYYATSRIESHKGLLLVLCGVEAKDSQQTIDIIQAQLEAMKYGDFTEKELAETKEIFLNHLRETFDSAEGMIELFYQQVVGNKPLTTEQFIKSIEAVTKNDIIEVAKHVELDTIYLLSNEAVEVTVDGQSSL